MYISRRAAETIKLRPLMDDWRKFVQFGNPTANPEYVKTVCEEIVRRAYVLAELHPVKPVDVAVFLLERSRDWVMRGTAVNEIAKRLPKTLGDLGVLKMSEGSDERHGGPLTNRELKKVTDHFKKKPLLN